MLLSSLHRIKQKASSLCQWNAKYSTSSALSDKFYVNYLKVPNFLRFFGPTGEEITKDVDLSNKTCVITGGTTGIGAEIIRVLLARDCNVAMACRNPYAASVVNKNIWNDSHLLTVYKMDLSSLESVQQCSEKIVDEQTKIDLVILNAAVFGYPWTITEDKLETIFQVNFLAQYLFLMNIEQNLSPDARIVFMSAESHRHVKWSVRDTLSPTEEMLSLTKDNYTSIKAYNISKLCGLLCMQYLTNKGRTVFCAHPGSFVSTNLSTNWWPYEMLYKAMKPFSKNIPQASSTPLFCATSPTLNGQSNLYFKDCKVCDPSDLALNSHLAFRIMDLTHWLIRERSFMIEDVAKAKTVEYEQKDEAKGTRAMEENVLSA